MEIPAYCPTCGAVFPSGISISESSNIFMDGNTAGPCPNGHMGKVVDGTFDVIGEVLAIKRGGPVTAAMLEHVTQIAKAAVSGETPPQDALDEILSVLPRESAAAIKKLGANNPLSIILIILAILVPASAIYSALKPNAPQPAAIINNNITIDNFDASGNGRHKSMVEGRSVTRMGRQQMERNKRKLASETKQQTQNECRPKRKKSRPPKNYQRHH